MPLTSETQICLIDPRGRGGALGDSCCPIEFICEHYLTFSKSLFRVILCLLGQRKNYGKILKTKGFLTAERGNYKILRAANMNLYLHLKWVF